MGEQTAATWTKEGLAALKRSYFDGLSMTRIAEVITEIHGWPMTRNQISGRIYRNGWVREGSRYTPAKKTPRRKKVEGPKFRKCRQPPARSAGRNAVPLTDLGAGSCHFPVGHHSGHLQLYCGDVAVAKSEYCVRCKRRMHPRLKKAAHPNAINAVDPVHSKNQGRHNYPREKTENQWV